MINSECEYNFTTIKDGKNYLSLSLRDPDLVDFNNLIYKRTLPINCGEWNQKYGYTSDSSMSAFDAMGQLLAKN